MLHLLNKRRENGPLIPVIGTVVPMLAIGKKDADKEDHDDDDSEAEDDKKNPLGFFKFFDVKRNKKNEHLKPHLLPRTLFTFGMSTININVQSYGEFEGDSGLFASAPVLRHALYANAIADGTVNFISGVLYASYTQTKDFVGEVKEGELTKFEFLGALVGLMLQGGVYAFYSAFLVPTVFFKLTSINKTKSKGKGKK